MLCGLGDDILVLACPVVLDFTLFTGSVHFFMDRFSKCSQGAEDSSVAYKLGKNSVRDQTALEQCL